MKNLGRIEHSKRWKRWEILCQPHVSIRLKRVFARIDSDQYDKLTLSDTPQNCRELLWFLSMYPMEVPEMAYLKDRAEEYVERNRRAEQILSGTYQVTPTASNLVMKKPPRDYQKLAAEVWWSIYGLLIGDAIGTGKTITALTGLTNDETIPALIVVQAHLVDQWVEKAEEFTHLVVHKIKQKNPYDFTKEHGTFPDILITNYHKLGGWAETLAPLMKSVVFDEVQELRHFGTQKYNAADHIARKVPFRLGLSASPVYNYGGEIFNVLNILRPDHLGTLGEFNREWCTHREDKSCLKDPRAFASFMKDEHLWLRRTRKELKKELPPVVPIVQKVNSDLKVYDQMQSGAMELAKIILSQKEDYRGQKMQANSQFDLKMRMATGLAKAPSVAEFVKLLIQDNDEKVVIFAWHRDVYAILMEQLAEFKPVMYTGSENESQKNYSKEQFIHGDSRVILISLRSGAGLDGLQDVCSIAIFAELDWSPAVQNIQCIGRLSRDLSSGEPCGSVTAYFLVSDNGSDPVMMDILGLKKQQVDGLIEPENEDIPVQVDPQHVKKLARSYLLSKGIVIDENPINIAEEILQ